MVPLCGERAYRVLLLVLLMTFNDSNYPIGEGNCRGKDLYEDNIWMYNKGSAINPRLLLVQEKTVFSDVG